jgi:hypothetical protein
MLKPFDKQMQQKYWESYHNKVQEQKGLRTWSYVEFKNCTIKPLPKRLTLWAPSHRKETRGRKVF